jgi:hypothetical protein
MAPSIPDTTSQQFPARIPPHAEHKDASMASREFTAIQEPVSNQVQHCGYEGRNIATGILNPGHGDGLPGNESPAQTLIQARPGPLNPGHGDGLPGNGPREYAPAQTLVQGRHAAETQSWRAASADDQKSLTLR